MTAPLTAEGYNAEVREAYVVLTAAQRARAAKDTPAARVAVDVARKRLDTLFDQRGNDVPNPMDMRPARR